MTKIAVFLALAGAAISAPALAQHAPQGGFAPMLGAVDPCVLGTNVQPGTCVGPVRVTQAIVTQGSVSQQQSSVQQSYVQAAPQPVYAPQQMAHVQLPSRAPVQMSGCVAGYNGPSVPCNGAWVPVSPSAPVMAAPAPAPVYVQQQVIQYAPQPQQVGMIPTSFFTGGITYGAGFPTETTYTYGGGGFAYSTGGGTRFSGVRERSPTPLTPPPMRQRHQPRPSHHGCGC